MSQEQEFAGFELDVNMEDVKPWDGDYRLPPPGEYQLIVEGLERTTIGNNTPAVKVQFAVCNNADESLNGAKVWNNYPLTPKALGRLKQFMIAGGGQLGTFVAQEYLGVVIQATIVHTLGEAKIGQDGSAMPARTFANVQNERPLEQEQAPAKTAEPPPIARGRGTGATTAPGPTAGSTKAASGARRT